MPTRNAKNSTANTDIKPNLGITDSARTGLTRMLNARLADVFVLYTKTRNYHWNVTGMHFHALHVFFESQYEQLDEAMDEVAERVRQLGGISAGTLDEFQKLTSLREAPGQVPSDKEMIANLLSDHEAVIRQLREDVDSAAEDFGDQGTSDFLTGLMEEHEKMAWMLRSFLES